VLDHRDDEDKEFRETGSALKRVQTVTWWHSKVLSLAEHSSQRLATSETGVQQSTRSFLL